MAPDPMSDLDHLISNAMGSAFEGARRALADEIRRRNDNERREARDAAYRALRDAGARLDAAAGQAELLTALLEEAGRFASRTALLLTFPDAAHGWAAYGFEGTIDHLRLAWDEPSLRELSGGRGTVTLGADAAAAFARQLGGGPPLEAVLVPLVLRDRVAAALYADRLRADAPFAPAALQLLTHAAALSLELQVVRQRAATPTLYGAGAGDAPAALPLWDPAAAAAAPAAAAVAAVATPAPEPAAPAAEAEPAAAPSEPAAEEPGFAAEEPAAEPAEPAAEPESEPWTGAVEEAAAEETGDAAAASEEPTAEPAYAAAPAEGAEALWQEAAPEPAELAEQESIESVPADEGTAAEEPWAAEAPTSPGGPAAAETWQSEPAPAPWEVEAEPAADEQAWGAQEEQVATLEEPGAEPAPEVAAEPWQYGEALEEVPAAPAEDTGTDYAAAAVEDSAEIAGVEEVGAAAVEEVEPAAEAGWQEPAAEPAWQEPAPPPAETTTSALYPESPPPPLYPSEATVRISRDQLGAGPLAPPPRAPEPDASEDRTVMLNRSELAPPTEVEQTRPTPLVPAPEPPRTTGPVSLPSSGGSTEVQPPPDLEGPGWAFRAEALPSQPQAQRAQQSEESGALHEEARRLARLLVSEIKLYNEEMVEEGRRHRDIYPRLQEDIDRSRQMYEERVDPRVRGEVDYFQQEMVNILAGGDAGALGM